MKKNILFIVTFVVVVIIIGAVYYKKSAPVQPQTSSRELPDSPTPISQYVLGGKVSDVQPHALTVTVQRVMVGPEGNYVETQTKKVTIGEATKLYSGKLVSKTYTKVPATVSDIKVGDIITMYSSENIARQDSFTPTRIDITR